ncbi:MAG: ACP S-malonyltransferase [Candidatus Eiseniibacteriota bacterium]
MKLAFLFPGQGSQAVGMGRSFAETHAEARSVFDEADRVLGFALSRIMWEGPEDVLKATENAQPALLVHSVAALRVVTARGLSPSYAAGHSLGEYSAHVAAGSLSFVDALSLVRRRGELMAEAGRAESGTMAAILGLDGDEVEAACAAVREAGDGTVVAANFNSPGQVVISGEIAAVEAAMAACKERGAKRAIRLPVSGAFHSPLMGPATEGLRAALAKVDVRDAAIPVIANVDAQPVSDADEIKDRLGRQLLGAVRWEESMRNLVTSGVGAFVELGSGKVLRGLLKQIAPDAKSANVDDAASLDETLTAIGAGARA